MVSVVCELQCDIQGPSEVDDIASRMSRKPNRPNSLYTATGMRAASNSFDPSSGGTGIILKMARNRLIRAADPHNDPVEGPECAATASSRMAKITLLAGPAIATI